MLCYFYVAVREISPVYRMNSAEHIKMWGGRNSVSECQSRWNIQM